MKVVLFCGGVGTRIREYSETIPKPMIPVGDQPILWHVMQYYNGFLTNLMTNSDMRLP
jgi:glucose-1-phosphate cytidylyltransferase